MRTAHRHKAASFSSRYTGMTCGITHEAHQGIPMFSFCLPCTVLRHFALDAAFYVTRSGVLQLTGALLLDMLKGQHQQAPSSKPSWHHTTSSHKPCKISDILMPCVCTYVLMCICYQPSLPTLFTNPLFKALFTCVGILQVLTVSGDRLPGRLVEAAATAAGLHLRTGCNCNVSRGAGVTGRRCPRCK